MPAPPSSQDLLLELLGGAQRGLLACMERTGQKLNPVWGLSLPSVPIPVGGGDCSAHLTCLRGPG